MSVFCLRGLRIVVSKNKLGKLTDFLCKTKLTHEQTVLHALIFDVKETGNMSAFHPLFYLCLYRYTASVLCYKPWFT